MTDIAPAMGRSIDYAGLSNNDLRAELAKQLSLTAESLLRAAAIWTEIQRRGIDMSALRSGLGSYLPLIARGQLAAEAVVTFAGQRLLLQSLAGMPIVEQRSYAAGEPIMVAERDGNGAIIEVSRRLNELSGREVALVISGGRVRSVTEQKSSLVQQVARPSRKRQASGSVARIVAQDGMVHVGRVRLEPLDLAPALKALGYELVRRKLE